MGPPRDQKVEEDEAPALFAYLRELRLKGAPSIYQVQLDGELNASMIQVPLLGPFGWYRNYLVIGLPLAQSMSEVQLKGIIAHELGHAWAGDGRLSTWSYRVNETWTTLASQLGQWDWVRKFAAWYGSFLKAYTRVLSRQQERQADRFALQSVPAREMADALLCIDLHAEARTLTNYWDEMRARSEVMEEPPARAFSDLGDRLRLRDPFDERMLARALAFSTALTDTHPCLEERLKSLAQAPRLPEKGGPDGAQALLGRAERRCLEILDRQWAETQRSTWSRMGGKRREDRILIEALRPKVEEGLLDKSKAGDYWRAVEELEGKNSAREAMKVYLDVAPEDAYSRFLWSCLLLDDDDEDGITQLRRVADEAPQYESSVAKTVAHYLERHGRQTEAVDWWVRAEIREATDEELEAKLYTINLWEEFRSPTIEEAARQQIIECLKGHPHVRRAWLFRRAAKIEPRGHVRHSLLLEPNNGFMENDVGKNNRMLDELLPKIKPHSGILLVASNSIGWLERRRYAKVPGAALDLGR